jgi:flagellar motility protein MotE (MotC chaperone)
MDAFLEAPDEDLNAVQAASSDTLESVFLELKERQDSLDRREAMISEQRRAVDALLMAAEKKLAALEQAEQDLRETISIAKSAADSDVAQLVSVYENMKPRDAALIFEEMEPSFAAGFLSRMRADAAAKIVQGLKPATAYSISVVLAGRNLGVATE